MGRVQEIPREALIIRPSFALPYGNAEIWCEELDGLSVYSDVVVEKFLADMRDIRRPSTPGLIAINLAGTQLDAELLALFAEQLCAAGDAVRRVAFVGLARLAKRVLRRELQMRRCGFVYACLVDFEQAKEWLVRG